MLGNGIDVKEAIYSRFKFSFLGATLPRRLESRNGLVQGCRYPTGLVCPGFTYRDTGTPGIQKRGVFVVVVDRPIGQLPVAPKGCLLSG